MSQFSDAHIITLFEKRKIYIIISIYNSYIFLLTILQWIQGNRNCEEIIPFTFVLINFLHT